MKKLDRNSFKKFLKTEEGKQMIISYTRMYVLMQCYSCVWERLAILWFVSIHFSPV